MKHQTLVEAQAALYEAPAAGAPTAGDVLAKTADGLPFIPFAKIDAEKHEVWGWAGEEAVDTTGREIMDYDASKPNWVAWSGRVKKISGGKSLGNVRGMHNDTIAAGKLIHFEPRDDLKKIWVGAKIVDPLEWYKVTEGVYNGFSPGGNYGKRWPDPSNPGLMRYEAIPIELTLADLPAMYGATFEMIKSAGRSELRKFAAPTADALAKAVDLDRLADAPRRAWYQQHENGAGEIKASSGEDAGYVRAVLDDRIIVERPDGLYAYAYTRGDNGAITFELPVKVQVDYVPVDTTATESTAALGQPMAMTAKPAIVYAHPTKPLLPLDTEQNIRSAWNHLRLRKTQRQHSRHQIKIMRERIEAAWRRTIDPAGPLATATTPEGGESIMKDILTKAAKAVDPQEVIGSIQALRNQAELDGDLDAANLYSTAIATIMDAAYGGDTDEPESGEDKTPAGDVPDAAAEPPAEETPAVEPDEALRQAAHALRATRLAKTAAPAVDLSAVAKADDLAKVIGAVSSLGETISPLVKMVTEVSDRLANLEAQPAGGGPVLRTTPKTIAGQETPEAATQDARRQELMAKAAGLRRSAAIEPNPMLAAQYQRDLLTIETELREIK